MLQSSLFDGVAFDPFAFQQDSLSSAEVDGIRPPRAALPNEAR
jgi:hypothetical protein